MAGATRSHGRLSGWRAVLAGGILLCVAAGVVAGILKRYAVDSRRSEAAATSTTGPEGLEPPANRGPRRLPGLVAGECEWFEEGGVKKVRIRYDFEDPGQIEDWKPAAGDDWIERGALLVSGGKPAVARFGAELAVERISVEAACEQASEEAGPHINIYANTLWGGSWEGRWGVSCILCSDGRLVCADGEEIERGVPPACTIGNLFRHEISIDPEGVLVWRIDDEPEPYRRSFPVIAGRKGSVLLGGYESSVRFERVEIVGVAAP